MSDDIILINEKSINNSIKVNQSIEKYGYVQRDPFTSSSFINRFFFHWAYRIIALCKNTLLKTEYLGNLGPQFRSQTFFSKISSLWRERTSSSVYPLLLTSLQTNLSLVILVILITFFNACINVLGIYYFRKYIQLFSNNEPTSMNHVTVGLTYLAIRLCDF